MLERSAASPKLLAAIAGCVALVFGALSFTGGWKHLELKGFDLLTLATAPEQSSFPITIVGIDEASFAQIREQWPWPRSLHAKLIDQLTRAGALVVAMDVLLAEPSRSGPADDSALADAIYQSGNVVLASDRVYQESAYIRQWLRVDPLPAFTQSGAMTGFAVVNPDRDQAVRQIPVGDDVFWRAIVRRANERQPGLLKVAEPEEGAMIRYVGGDHTFPYVSYYQALEADKLLPANAFRDQIVLIGRDLKANVSSDAALGDNFPTPFTLRSGWLTPGVEVHANVLESAIRGDALRPVSMGWNLALLGFCVALCALAMRNWRPAVSGAVVIAVIGAVLALDWALFTHASLWLPVFATIAGSLSVYLAFGAVAYLAEQRRKNEMRRAFSLYVSPEVVDHVIAHPESLALGGERRDVTLLFTDLAGFTTFTEQLGPEQVTRILNVHFTRATAIVKRHNGTVNRFIGDAIMAMWGAPIADDEQAAHACRAAIEMQADMEALRREFLAEGLPEVRMRVGIHSCNAVIGNLGSSDRFDYTAIGDGVNLASRLEGVNKLYGTKILLSGETRSRAGSSILMRQVDRVIVKGKSEPVEIYTPCEDTVVNEASAKAIAAYRARRWEESELFWREILKRVPDDGIAPIYLERIQRLRVTSPEPDWEGAVELEKL